MIQVYGVSGSRALRSMWALEEAGVEWELVPTNFMRDTKEPAYLALNPNGRVPTLVDGDLVLIESMAINLYLAKAYGGALWPESEADQARAIQWSFWGMTEIEPHLIAILLHKIMLPEEQRDAKQAADAAVGIRRPLKVLEAHLAKRAHLLGGEFTIADLNVASVLSMAGLVGYDISAFSAASAWFERCTARPALARAQAR